MTKQANECCGSSPSLLEPERYPVLVIAHRGASGSVPENTLASFRKAIDVGSDVVELDVRLSQDEQVVVIHDEALGRTLQQNGRVSELRLTQLRELDAGSWFDSQFSGERIPTLIEVLKLAKGRVRLNIELKTSHLGRYSIQRLADAALRDVEKLSMEEQVMFCSFSIEGIERVQARNSIPTALVYDKEWLDPEELTCSRLVRVFSCRKTYLNRDNISRAHDKGVKVWAWTVDDQNEIQHVLDIGVDGIITNYPERVIEFLGDTRNA